MHIYYRKFQRCETMGRVHCCDAWIPLMDRKVVGAVLFGIVAEVTSPATAG